MNSGPSAFQSLFTMSAVEGLALSLSKSAPTEVHLVYNAGMKMYIISNPKIMSGAPVIANTRVPVVKILYLLKEGFTLKEISKQYPHISLQKLKGAISELAQRVETKPYGTQVSQAQASA